MSTSVLDTQPVGQVVVGVDTHKHVHVAVVLDVTASRLAELSIATDTGGYDQLARWAEARGRVLAFGIEGTGSYGAALASFLRRRGHKIIEVNRPDRRVRRQRGKSDAIDAENAARAVLAGTATATPKSGQVNAEMIRVLKVARDQAVVDRTQALITLKILLITAPVELRDQLRALTGKPLLRACAALRPGPLTTPAAAAKHSMRALARRWIMLDAEINEHDALLADLVRQAAPSLTQAFGIGVDTAAEILIVTGDNPARVHSQAAFAKLAGVAPVPASSGMHQRDRLNRGGHRQLNAALYRTVIVRMRFHEPTRAYVERRTAEGKTKREIIRCLGRYLAREVYQILITGHTRALPPRPEPTPAPA